MGESGGADGARKLKHISYRDFSGGDGSGDEFLDVWLIVSVAERLGRCGCPRFIMGIFRVEDTGYPVFSRGFVTGGDPTMIIKFHAKCAQRIVLTKGRLRTERPVRVSAYETSREPRFHYFLPQVLAPAPSLGFLASCRMAEAMYACGINTSIVAQNFALMISLLAAD